jgi:hypothetical protein
MGWMRHLPGILLLTIAAAGCKGPSCESACRKAFSTCALTSFSPDSSIDAEIQACSSACAADMGNFTTEARAVGWVACVDEFECNPADEGLRLCVTCQAGYYLGENTGTACSYEETAP